MRKKLFNRKVIHDLGESNARMRDNAFPSPTSTDAFHINKTEEDI